MDTQDLMQESQAQKLVHVSNLYYTEPQAKLAGDLTSVCFADKVFFGNSGAEANEAAIKLARKYSRQRYGPGRYGIITMKDSFHGRTLATLSATGQHKVQEGFEPLVDGFRYVDFDELDAVAEAIDETVCAVLVEPIQGEGGVRVPKANYLAGLRELCSKQDLLLIYDESLPAAMPALLGVHPWSQRWQLRSCGKSTGKVFWTGSRLWQTTLGSNCFPCNKSTLLFVKCEAVALYLAWNSIFPVVRL